MTAPLVVFPFRYRDARTGRWVKARYMAERAEIAARYAEWEIIGPGEQRRPAEGGFNPAMREGGFGEPGRSHEPSPRRVLTDGEEWDLYAWDAPRGDPNKRYAAFAPIGQPLMAKDIETARPLQAVLSHLDLDEWDEVL